MTPTAETIWRELHTHAGPSSAIPSLPENFFDAINADGATVDLGILELMVNGAIVPLTQDELSRLACHKRIGGDFVILTRRTGCPSHYRIIDPIDLKQSVSAQLEAFNRELALLLPQRMELPTAIAGEPLHIDRIISDLKLGTCWYRLSNQWPLQKVVINGEDRLELVGPMFGDRRAARWGFVNERVNWVSRCLSPSGEVWSVLLTALLRDMGMTLEIDPQAQAIHDRCNVLKASLDRLAGFELPAWSSVGGGVEFQRERIPRDVQQEVWRRDQGKCVQCGSKEKLEFDHVIPWSKGGSCTARNIQLLCELCNRTKSNRI